MEGAVAQAESAKFVDQEYVQLLREVEADEVDEADEADEDQVSA